MPDFTREQSDIAVRFHRDTEWLTVTSVTDQSVAGDDGGDTRSVWALRVHANAERAVELFYRLAAALDPIVDVSITHVRDGQSWDGVLRFLPDVRDAVGRLRWPLAMSGGVELTVYTGDDQLTLTPSLDVVIYSRNDRWLGLVEAEGVSRDAVAARNVWSPGATGWGSAPELHAALALTADRLALTASNSGTASAPNASPESA